MDNDKTSYTDLPPEAIEYIDAVIKKMRYRKKICADVRAELTAHFQDALRDCDTEEEKTKLTADLTSNFGEPKILAKLIRRGKKRCRPLWQQVITQAVKVITVIFLLYTVWFVTGTPVVETDYLALLNQKQRDIKQGLLDENNALYDYEKAGRSYVEPSKKYKVLASPQRGSFDVEMTDSEEEAVRQWLKANEPTWQHLVAGTMKPYYYTEHVYNEENTDRSLRELGIPIPKFWHHALDIGSWRTIMALKDGDIKEALDVCLKMIRFAPHFAKSHILLEHMMGSLSIRINLNYIMHIISTYELSAAELENLQQQLSGLFPNGYPYLALVMEMERVTSLDIIQHIFTDSGYGGGHLIPKQLKKSDALDNMASGTVSSMFHIGRDETAALANEFWDISIKETCLSPYQIRTRGSMREQFRNDLADMIRYQKFLYIIDDTVYMSGKIERNFNVRADYEAVMTILALQRWKLDKGRYPESLDSLVADGYLKQLPMDPFSDESLVYRMADDGFTLYSAGRNMIDDGGKYGTTSKGKKKQWGENGDVVFWPVWKDEN